MRGTRVCVSHGSQRLRRLNASQFAGPPEPLQRPLRSQTAHRQDLEQRRRQMSSSDAPMPHRSTSLERPQFPATQRAAGMKNDFASPFPQTCQRLGTLTDLAVRNKEPHDIRLNRFFADHNHPCSNSSRQPLRPPLRSQLRSRDDFRHGISRPVQGFRKRTAQAARADDRDTRLLRTFSYHCPQHNSARNR